MRVVGWCMYVYVHIIYIEDGNSLVVLLLDFFFVGEKNYPGNGGNRGKGEQEGEVVKEKKRIEERKENKDLTRTKRRRRRRKNIAFTVLATLKTPLKTQKIKQVRNSN